MFRITGNPSSGSLVQCLAKNYKNDSIIFVDMDKVGVMAAYSDTLCVCVVHCIYIYIYIHSLCACVCVYIYIYTDSELYMCVYIYSEIIYVLYCNSGRCACFLL